MSDPLRFFIGTEEMSGELVKITGETFHHLRNVLRTSQGETITLLDGHGNACEVVLTEVGTESVNAQVVKRWQAQKPPLSITLIQSLPKGDKLDLILQKGTELGTSCFQPVVTDHTIPQLTASKLSKRQQRWQRIVEEAARQSRRFFLPEVTPLATLTEALSNAKAETKLVLWESATTPLNQALQQKIKTEVELLIGPEGGFSTKEIETITTAGFTPVHIGPRILRTETAGLAATAILQYLYGDLKTSP